MLELEYEYLSEYFRNDMLNILGKDGYVFERISDSLTSKDNILNQLQNMSYTDGVFAVGKFKTDPSSSDGHYAHIDLNGTLTNSYPHNGSTWPSKYTSSEYTLFRLREKWDYSNIPAWY